MAPEGSEDVAHGGPGDVTHGGPGKEEREEAGLLGTAQGGLQEAAPAGPVELRPAEKVEIPPFDIWTVAGPKGERISADAQVEHPITKELCFPQDFAYVFDWDINHCRKMTEWELQRCEEMACRRARFGKGSPKHPVCGSGPCELRSTRKYTPIPRESPKAPVPAL